MASNEIVGSVLVISSLVSLVVNTLTLVIWIMRKRIRRPNFYLIFHLVIADLLAQVFWTLISVVLAFTGDTPSATVCQLQGVVKDFIFILNKHSLFLLALERVIRIYKPSKHSVMFIGTVVIILLFGIWVFDFVTSLLPVIGWSSYIFFPSQFQCVPDSVNSVSQLNFFFVVAWAIPTFGLVLCYFAIWKRIRRLKQKITPQGAIVLEKSSRPVGDTYSDRLKRQQDRFNMAGMKKKAPYIFPKVQKFTEDGYEFSSDSSSDEEGRNTKEMKIKRVYYLARADNTLARTFFITSLCYDAFWLPYFIVTYIYTYDLYTSTSVAFPVVVCLSHCSCFIKPLVLFTNKRLRDYCTKSQKKRQG